VALLHLGVQPITDLGQSMLSPRQANTPMILSTSCVSQLSGLDKFLRKRQVRPTHHLVGCTTSLTLLYSKRMR
jgi:hypothetical protein